MRVRAAVSADVFTRRGHTSAKPPTAGRQKMLYLREDVIVAQLPTHSSLAGRGRNPHDMTTFLRTNEMTIVCDHQTGALGSDVSTQISTPRT